MAWLDALAVGINLQHSFVLDENQHRVPGCYQYMSPEDAARFRRVLNSKAKQWIDAGERIASEMTCGNLMEMGGGQGCPIYVIYVLSFKLEH